MFTDVYCEMFTSLETDYKFRTAPELQGLIPVIYCEKCGFEFFDYYAMLPFFFGSGLAKHG